VRVGVVARDSGVLQLSLPLAFQFLVELFGSIGVERVGPVAASGEVSPVLVDPEPLLRMLPDDGFEAIPADLHYLVIRRIFGELKRVKKPCGIAAIRPSQGDKWKESRAGPLVQQGVDHRGPHPQAKSRDDSPWVIHLEREVDQDSDVLSSSEGFHEPKHRSLPGDDAVAGFFPDLLENRSQAVVFESLGKDMTVETAEGEKGASPLEIPEMRGNTDSWASALTRQDGGKCIGILE